MPSQSQVSGANTAVVSDTGLSDDTGALASQDLLTARRVLIFTAAVAQGDAPINALLQNETVESRLTLRKAKVEREVNDAVAKLDQASTK